MSHRFSVIASFAFVSLLAGCPDEPPPGEPVELVVIDCGRAECESGAPMAIGARMVVQPAELGVVARIVPTSGAAAVEVLEPGNINEQWVVTGVRAGATELELRDERDRVVGRYALEVDAIEHFEASIVWHLGGRAFVDSGLRSDEPHNFGQPGRLRVVMHPFVGASELRGALNFEIGLSLPATSAVLENDPSGNVFIEAGSGENRMTFRAGDHAETFRF
jgi:hypothetical protein